MKIFEIIIQNSKPILFEKLLKTLPFVSYQSINNYPWCKQNVFRIIQHLRWKNIQSRWNCFCNNDPIHRMTWFTLMTLLYFDWKKVKEENAVRERMRGRQKIIKKQWWWIIHQHPTKFIFFSSFLKSYSVDCHMR